MEKKAKKYILNNSPIHTCRTDLPYDCHCTECDTLIEKGDTYVKRSAHFLYCIPCAKKISKSVSTCFKKRKYLSPADAITRARTVVKTQAVYQIPYRCPHCQKYHLTTVQKRDVPKQLLRIYQTDVVGPPLTQAVDKYLLEYEV